MSGLASVTTTESICGFVRVTRDACARTFPCVARLTAHDAAYDSRTDPAAAVDLALVLADVGAERGDYTRAVRWLAVAESIGGKLPWEYAIKRRSWHCGRTGGVGSFTARS